VGRQHAAIATNPRSTQICMHPGAALSSRMIRLACPRNISSEALLPPETHHTGTRQPLSERCVSSTLCVGRKHVTYQVLCPDLPVRKTLNVPLSTDKGMCGGINTGVAKLARACVKLDIEGVHLPVLCCQVSCNTPFS
jgi:hypothetical protein